MGLIHVTATLRASRSARRKYEADFLVDTGATDSMAPGRKLRKIGIVPVGRTTYELADGVPKEFEFGTAVIKFMGDITAGRVIFGPDDAEPILGVTALESTGIVVDPRKHTLERLPAIPLKATRAGEPPECSDARGKRRDPIAPTGGSQVCRSATPQPYSGDGC